MTRHDWERLAEYWKEKAQTALSDGDETAYELYSRHMETAYANAPYGPEEREEREDES
jgi:hypothetical protein